MAAVLSSMADAQSATLRKIESLKPEEVDVDNHRFSLNPMVSIGYNGCRAVILKGRNSQMGLSHTPPYKDIGSYLDEAEIIFGGYEGMGAIVFPKFEKFEEKCLDRGISPLRLPWLEAADAAFSESHEKRDIIVVPSALEIFVYTATREFSGTFSGSRLKRH